MLPIQQGTQYVKKKTKRPTPPKTDISAMGGHWGENESLASFLLNHRQQDLPTLQSTAGEGKFLRGVRSQGATQPSVLHLEQKYQLWREENRSLVHTLRTGI